MICAGGSGCLIAAQSLRGALTGLAGLASGIMGRYLKWLESRAVMLRWMLVRVQPDPPGAPRRAIPASNVRMATGAQIAGGCTHETLHYAFACLLAVYKSFGAACHRPRASYSSETCSSAGESYRLMRHCERIGSSWGSAGNRASQAPPEA